MNLLKLIGGILLLALIPAHWFIAGITLTAIGGGLGFLIVIFWIALFIAAISLIVSGITETKTVIKE